MAKRKRARSRAKAALREHCVRAWRPDQRTLNDADAFAGTGARGAELAAAVVMLSFATPQALTDSRWLDLAVRRAVSMVRGMDPVSATTVLERVVRDLHRRGVVTGPDAMAQLCNIEMQRRALGCDPQSVEPPPTHEGEPDDLLLGTVMWETMSYAEGFVAETMPDPERWPAVTVAIMFIVREVAFTTGVPVRLETMVPARIAEIFDGHDTPPEYEPISSHELFEVATEFVGWLGDRGILSPERAPTLKRQLRALTSKAKRRTRVRSGVG